MVTAAAVLPLIHHPPRHVAVIMDGNGRWAKQRGLSRTEGHEAGSRTVRSIVTECRRLGIGHLTLYTFSRENWGRPKAEILFLFGLLRRFLKQELPLLLEKDIRLSIFGEPGDLPLAVRRSVQRVLRETEQCSSMRLNLALNYSGREEIVRACKTLLAEGADSQRLTEADFSAHLWSAGQPDPDLVIRTSGEYRISNFLLFQSAYAEYYFTPTLWPDFTEEEFHRALADFSGRQRRFGLAEVSAPGNTEVYSA